MWRTALGVLRSPASLALTLAAALAAFLLQVWLPNLGLIWSVVTAGDMATVAKAQFLWTSLGALETNFTVLGAWLAVAVALLFGLNVAFSVHFVRQRLAVRDVSTLGVGGLFAAVLGVGCASCGAVVLSFVVGTTAAASIVGLLPLGGQELNLLAVAVLAAALVVTLRKLARPDACPRPPSAARRR